MKSNSIEKIRLLVLGCNRFDSAILADSLRIQGLDVVGESTTPQSARELMRTVRPDVLVVDFQGCDLLTLQLFTEMREINIHLGIVLLTDSPDLRLYGIQASQLPIGTQLIEKSSLVDVRDIRSAIEESLKPEIATQWISHEDSSELYSLTDIQIETLRLLAQGLSNSDIGKSRYVSEKSVEQTITRVAQHLKISHEKGRNMRVIMASQYYRWLGAAKDHAI